MLSCEDTELSFSNTIHAKDFCEIAKSSDKGYLSCVSCKSLSSSKAVKEKKPFFGHCFYGLFEVVYPVIKDNSVGAIIYVGGAIVDEAETAKRLERSCRYTGVSAHSLSEQLLGCERRCTPQELYDIAAIISEYLLLLSSHTPERKEKIHWLVKVLKRYAEESFDTRLTLKELASLYHKNEKYLGRLFKKEMGLEFSDYCLSIKLENAEKLLIETDLCVLDIALECGFNNVSYFNRVFKRKNGITPLEFRRNK